MKANSPKEEVEIINSKSKKMRRGIDKAIKKGHFFGIEQQGFSPDAHRYHYNTTYLGIGIALCTRCSRGVFGIPGISEPTGSALDSECKSQ